MAPAGPVIRRLGLLAVTALLVAACVRPGLAGLTVVTSDAQSTGATTLLGDIVVLGGSLSLDPGSTVRGSVHVLDGEVRVNGTVSGSVTVVGGAARLGPAAVVDGDVAVAIGSALEISPEAVVRGEVREGLVVDDAVADAAGDPVGLLLRLAALLVALIAAGQLAPGRVAAAAAYAARMPAPSLAFGFLVGVVGLVLGVFMAFTIVLVPVAVLTLAGLAALGLLGLAGLSAALGARLAQLHPRLGRLHPLATTLIVGAAPAVPVLGGFVLPVVALWSLGAVGLSLQRGVPEAWRGAGPDERAG